ncbi:MAG: fasciclin domain-containing protein [Daejeonella sp.]
MKNIILSFIKPLALFSAFLIIMATSCSKDKYFVDGGKSDPVFKGNMLQFLNSNAKFDTIAQIVKLAEMEDVFKNEKITFFCPTDEVIRRTIGTVKTGGLNSFLFSRGKDTIKTLSDVEPAIWIKYLSRYIYKGAFKLKDYPQLDFSLKPVYPGAFYYSINNDLANIGVVYNPVNGVKYTGYRQLSISFLPDPSSPDKFIPAAVATSDIQPSNGVVHVLAIALGNNIGEVLTSTEANYFGFGGEFMNEVVLSK